MNAYTFTGRLFYALVAAWVVAVVAGSIRGLPYFSRSHSGVTLPIYGGLIAGALAACNLASGAIWRGSAREIERGMEPIAYWIAIGILAGVSGILLIVGITNWMALQP